MVITTVDWKACLRFYSDVLGLQHECVNGHHAFYFGSNKINLHTKVGEFYPRKRSRHLAAKISA